MKKGRKLSKKKFIANRTYFGAGGDSKEMQEERELCIKIVMYIDR